MRVLVTGGYGFIGSHLVRSLLEEGESVRVLDNFATGRLSNLADVRDDVDLVEGDLRSFERASKAIRGCEIVFHQAALPSVPRSVQDPLTSSSVNAAGTQNILLAARDEGVRRVVSASSSSVYGFNPSLPKREDMATLPMSPYAVDKLASEGYCRSFHRVYGLDTVVLRYFNVFGPRQDPNSQYSAVIPNFINAALDGESPTVHGDGTQSRDFTFVADVVSANLLAARAPALAAGEVFNIACGNRTSLNEMLEMLGEMTGGPIVPLHDEARVGDVPHSQADITKAREGLGFEPAYHFSDGLKITLEHYQEARPALTRP